METSLSVGNDAVLRSARRWIIAAYVWQILSLLFGSASPSFFDNPEMWSNFDRMFSYFSPFVFLTVLSIGVLKLRKHSFPRFRLFANLILIGVGVPVFVSLLCMLTFDIGTPDSLIYQIFDRIASFVGPLAGYLFCVAYTYLLKNDVVNAAYRPAIAILYLAAFVNVVRDMSFWISSIAFDILDKIQIQIQYFVLENGSKIIYLDGRGIMMSILFIIVCIANILGYKYLLATPSEIPAAEDAPATFSFRPSKIEIGFIVSVALFVILAYFSIKAL